MSRRVAAMGIPLLTLPMLLFSVVAARAKDAGSVRGRAVDAGRHAVKDADVLLVVKTWAGGYRQVAHQGKTDQRGRFSFDDVVPKEGRYAVALAVVPTDDHALASRYVTRDQGGPIEEVELDLPSASPLTLRFVDAAENPLSGVRVRPSRRKDATGTEHLVYAQGAEPIVLTSAEDGRIAVSWFARGDEAGIAYTAPGAEEAEHAFRVGDGEEVTVRVGGTPPVSETFRTAGGNERMRYRLHGEGGAAPDAGFGLLLVLPGGDGGPDFSPFVRRIHENAVPDSVLTAQLVAPRWSEDQEIVWPTKALPTKGMGFSTEDFVRAVVKDVAADHAVDPQRIWALSWSSSGPAVYAASLVEDSPIRGSFVAMSVFKPDLLAPLERAKGKAYYLFHSKEDRTCPYWMAAKAEKALRAEGARVTLVTYEGGHGWHGNVFEELRKGIRWLDGP